MRGFIKAFPKIGIIELAAALVLLFYLLAAKLFFRSEFEQIKVFYKEEILSQTSVDEVLS